MHPVIRLMAVPVPDRDDDWLRDGLQAAIELELSTIPPYLYAAWSIDPNGPDDSGCLDTILSIAREEMLHMGIACNLLVAIGGTPAIASVAPCYPAQLPKGVHHGLVIDLGPLTRDRLREVFMAIEEPSTHLVEDPDFTPSGTTLIGDFYAALLDQFTAETALSANHQVKLSALGSGPFVITDLQGVRNAIGLIRSQGEGTDTAPFESPTSTGLGHFYQFGEMFHGRRLTTSAPFSYAGDPVRLPAVRAVPPAAATLPESVAFDSKYQEMLDTLEKCWTGQANLRAATRLMFELPDLAETLIGTGFGPAFRPADGSAQPTPLNAASP